MRESLLETFDTIYILNLHGNTRKKETAPDGGKDENVFNIQQGTAICVFVRNPVRPVTKCLCTCPPPLPEGKPAGKPEGKRASVANVFYRDLYGKRAEKYIFLETHVLNASNFSEIVPQEPDYYFVPKDFSLQEEYNKGFGVHKMFIKQGTGIKFRKDNLLVKNHFSRNDVETMLHDIAQLEDKQLLDKYKTQETKDWTLKEKRQYFLDYRVEDIKPVLYRVFDRRWTYYPMDKISNIIVRGDARKDLMRHLMQENLVLLTLRNQPTVQEFDRVFIAKGMIEHCVIGRGTYAFPLYYYDGNGEKKLNLNEVIVGEIAKRVGSLPFVPDVFDYIYGMLHDPAYRAKYQEFLKIDFLRVPYPNDAAEFERYVRMGSRLRKLHLLEEVPAIQTTFPISGGNVVENVRFVDDNVFINETQCFTGVPVAVWNFYIGGSCPVQKYLKDRKGRVLTVEEIHYYQKIVAVLDECGKCYNVFQN
jgi:predicted helicase